MALAVHGFVSHVFKTPEIGSEEQLGAARMSRGLTGKAVRKPFAIGSGNPINRPLRKL